MPPDCDCVACACLCDCAFAPHDVAKDALLRAGKQLKLNLTGEYDRPVRGGPLDFSFAVLKLRVEAKAMTFPFRLIDGRLHASGFHFGVHSADAGDTIGLRNEENTWTCEVMETPLTAKSVPVWSSSGTRPATWSLYTLIDAAQWKPHEDWRQQDLVAT